MSRGRVRRLSPQIWTYVSGASTTALPTGALTIEQLPSEAFGDGRHPTTRLCAGALDVLLRRSQSDTVLDVGTGTGILARIARLRGVPNVVATDIDPRALDAARRNFDLDRIETPIELADRAPDHWGARFDVVVANILEAPLLHLAPAIGRALAPNGVLMISGFTLLQSPALQVAYTDQKLSLEGRAQMEEWALLMFAKV